MLAAALTAQITPGRGLRLGWSVSQPTALGRVARLKRAGSLEVHLQRERGELRATPEELLPRAGGRRGAVYGELPKLPAPDPDR